MRACDCYKFGSCWWLVRFMIAFAHAGGRAEGEDDEEARERLNEMHESLRQEGQDRMENARQERKKRRERLLEGGQERDLFFK